jgi:prephenate dehydrogenase
MTTGESSKPPFRNVKIVGSGLIGSSIGLALTALGIRVSMVDVDETAEKLAQDLMATPSFDLADLVILALPSSELSSVLDREFELNPKAIFMDIGSIKVKPLLDVSTSKMPSSRFLATHPMAGREVGGVSGARADLFKSRSWIYAPHDLNGGAPDGDVIDGALWVIESLGATAIALSAPEHDRAVALVSHLPQVVSSLLAAQLNGAAGQHLELAGAGLRDMVRIAGSPPPLWDEILSANSAALLPLLINLQSDLGRIISDLGDGNSVSQFIKDGNAGKAAIPGKHGGKPREYSQLPVVIEDKPGQLAALFDECAKVKVNVEDLTIEHSPGQFTGLITLALSAGDAKILQDHLTATGWKVHSPR